MAYVDCKYSPAVGLQIPRLLRCINFSFTNHSIVHNIMIMHVFSMNTAGGDSTR